MSDDFLNKWLNKSAVKKGGTKIPGRALKEYKDQIKRLMDEYPSGLSEVEEIYWGGRELNPYDEFLNRNYAVNDEVDLDLFNECLWYMDITGIPLPYELISMLRDEIKFMKSRRNPIWLKREPGRPKVHPYQAGFQEMVVSYVFNAFETGWDKTPMKTIKEKFGISRSTFQEWKYREPSYWRVKTKHEFEGLIDELEDYKRFWLDD